MKNKWVTLSLLLVSGFFSSVAISATDEGIVNALNSHVQSTALLENLVKKSSGTPKERDLLIRLLESEIQVDRLSKQKAMIESKGASAAANPEVQKKIEFYSTRFITVYPKDEKIYRVYSMRAKAREELGKLDGVIQDGESVLVTAPKNAEERLKASVKLGELYRSKGNLARSEVVLTEVLKDSKGEWTSFILESLLQTQNQGRAYSKALGTLNRLIQVQKTVPGAALESLYVAKGQILGKLLANGQIKVEGFYSEMPSYAQADQQVILRTAIYELTIVNHEEASLQLVQHERFRSLEGQRKLGVASELAVMLYDQKGYEPLAKLMEEMRAYAAPMTTDPKIMAEAESGLKKLTELSQKIQSAISKDTKISHQSEGKILEALYSVIAKVNTKGTSIQAEVNYNKAGLFLVQDRPDAAYPIFKALGNFKDSEEKFHYAFLKTLKKSKVVPESWEFQTRAPASALAASEAPSLNQDLTSVAQRYCALTTFKESFCFDSLKGLVKLGKTDLLESLLKPIVFDAKRTDSEREQAFTALFDYYQNSKQSVQATALVTAAEKQGVHLSHAVAADAKKSIKTQSLATVQKLYQEGKNAEILDFTKKFETENATQVFPELFALAGLSAQRLGKDDVAQAYYVKYDQAADGDAAKDSAFSDLVAVGHAIAFERSFEYPKASYWWTKVKTWKDVSQKRLAMNATWLAADLTKFKTLILTPGFCDKGDASACDEFKKLFSATWPVYTKEFGFQKESQPKSVLDHVIQLQVQDSKQASRFKWMLEMHEAYTSLDPVRQVALFPTFQKLVKAELQAWSERETAQFKKVTGLMSFQGAVKRLKSAEADLAPLAKSNWTDFQVYSDIALGLVFEASVAALDRAKAKDAALLSQDPSVKQMFDGMTQQLSNKQNEVMARGVARTKNFSLDLAVFDGLVQKFPEWNAVSKIPVAASPASFYAGLTGRTKFLKDQWQQAFQTFNWPKVGYCVVQLSSDKTIPETVAHTFEAETFLRFGNRIDAQSTLAEMTRSQQNTVTQGPAPASLPETQEEEKP